jgi:hypothetical protein
LLHPDRERRMTANYQPLLDTRPFFIETTSGSERKDACCSSRALARWRIATKCRLLGKWESGTVSVSALEPQKGDLRVGGVIYAWEESWMASSLGPWSR